MGWRLVAPIAAAVVLAACGADGPTDTLSDGRSGDPPPPVSAGPITMNDEAALAWLQRECASCHGTDPTTGTTAPYHSAWPLPAEGITLPFLEVSELTPIAYQTLRHAALGVSSAPAPMPPEGVDEVKTAEIKAVIDWFQRAVPYAVIDADARYGNESAAKEKILVDFRCAKPSSLRVYLARVTMGAFDRPPTAEELGWFTEAELSAPVTRAQRDLVVSKLDGPWRKELLDIGVRKLATVVGGAPTIREGGEITAAVANDLREELYRSFLARYDEATWADYFTSNTVMATPNTAPLYGCAVDEGWRACELKAPRGGFFTTIGFLSSRPQSFLLENNNHGRVASLFFTLYGEALLAATSGPTGSDAIPPLPDCLEPTDTREFQGAPRGTAAVPKFGKVCQSCHLSRHMAAGSVLFRPFSTTGQVYTVESLGQPGTPDAALVTAAMDPAWSVRTATGSQAVSQEFLTSLLGAPPRSCINTGKPGAGYVSVASVAELANQLIANQSSFARGFMRHAHRAFSNLPSITLEMGLRALDAFENRRTTLPDLIKTYFATDTLACEADR